MNYNIRLEEPKDYRRVEEITREAFWNLYHPGCDEHYIAHLIRQSPDFIPELTFVIELDGEIIGSIFYTYSTVVSEDGVEHKVISFGPVSISPELHRKGLGKALIEHSIKDARKMGHKAIFIGGYPYHYEPYGFVGSKKYNVSMPDGKFYTGIMALPLYENALDEISGKLYFSGAFEFDENALEEFDKTFPPKEKLVKDSQKKFEIASTTLDERVYP